MPHLEIQIKLDRQITDNKTEPSVAKAHNYIGQGGTLYQRNVYNWLGTPHNIERKQLMRWAGLGG